MADSPQMKDSAADLDCADNGTAQEKTAPAETRSLNKRWGFRVPWDQMEPPGKPLQMVPSRWW